MEQKINPKFYIEFKGEFMTIEYIIGNMNIFLRIGI